jgi:hypothetical protein
MTADLVLTLNQAAREVTRGGIVKFLLCTHRT